MQGIVPKLEQAVTAAELSGTLKELLLKLPCLTRIPIGRLYQLALSEGWPKYEFIHCGSGPSPTSVNAIGLLCDAWKSLCNVEFREDGAIYIPVQDSLIEKPAWTLIYLAIAAWAEVHKPEVSDAKLTDEERMNQIADETPTTFAGLDSLLLIEAVQIARRLGWGFVALDSRRGVPNQSGIVGWLEALANDRFVHGKEGMYMRYGESWGMKPADNRWRKICDALIQRSASMAVDIPATS